jgi:hypothetical protein
VVPDAEAFRQEHHATEKSACPEKKHKKELTAFADSATFQLRQSRRTKKGTQ